jgi:glycyl-tRNA synthetase
LITFQDAILTLARFWADQGCMLWHPYNVQVGAGTIAPATGLLDIRDAVLEVGTEALPATHVSTALKQSRRMLPQWLDEARLSYGGARIADTPRRLVVYVERLAPRQRDEERFVKGPPASLAFDKQGGATRAAKGFAHRQRLPIEQLQAREIDGKPYLVALTVKGGQPTTAALAELWPNRIASLRFNRTMRWNRASVAF